MNKSVLEITLQSDLKKAQDKLNRQIINYNSLNNKLSCFAQDCFGYKVILKKIVDLLECELDLIRER